MHWLGGNELGRISIDRTPFRVIRSTQKTTCVIGHQFLDSLDEISDWLDFTGKSSNKRGSPATDLEIRP